jgi:hypothetical protein
MALLGRGPIVVWLALYVDAAEVSTVIGDTKRVLKSGAIEAQGCGY